jgi:capsular exopolysaccharide synthesis family protein
MSTMPDKTTSSNNPYFGQYPDFNSTGGSETASSIAAIWRYRWAVFLPTVIGTILAFVAFLKSPETFSAQTLLMIESDRPAVLDAMTGDFVGGVPPIDILSSQLFSDRVVSRAFMDERFGSYREKFNDNAAQFAGAVHGGLKLTPTIQSGRSGSALVAQLSFTHQDAELCEQAVKVFSDAMQQFFAEKHKSSRSELLRLISVATDQLQPKMEKLEQQYRDFRTEAPLVWGDSGQAVNPHRERQLFLTQRRSELFEQLRKKAIESTAIESITKESKDPTVGLSIVGQLTGSSFSIPEPANLTANVRENDMKLAQIEIDQKLLPLIVERNKYASELGASHPTVKAMDDELSMMKQELRRLVKEQTERIVELMNENKIEGVDPAQRARDALAVILVASRAEVDLLKTQIADLEAQISIEKAEAIKLSRYEQENSALLREIDRNRELIEQLEQQMARVSLTEEEGGVRVVELAAPSKARTVGPNMSKMIGMGMFIGLALGCGMALLLEKNANTFREPDEIVAAIDAPILTHVPFFKGKVRKSKPDNPNPFESLDPHLAVVHTPSSVPAEAIRSCRTSLFFELAGIAGGKILQVTSPLPGDGKSTIAGNLACSIAQSGKRTLLIDCDLRRPQITDNFSGAEKFGLIDVLDGKCEYLDAIHDTPLAPLKLMPSGPIPANPAEALSLPEMSELLEMLRDEFDYIVLDTPPLLVVTDPSILASMSDGVVMALKIRRKSKPNTKEAAGILRTVGARILGVVINNSDESSSSDGYKGYGYYRYGRHTSRYYRKSMENGAKAGQLRTPIVVSGRGGMARPMKVQPSVVAAVGSKSDVATKMNGHASHDQS